MSSVDAIANAWKLHQSGRFADAARSYHALLEQRADDPDMLHLFGILHHQHGYFARAVELIGRAVTLRPQTAAFHANLAEAYRELGQPKRAIESCLEAMRLQPLYPEAANNYGLALHDLERFEEAVVQYRAALEMRTDFALAQNNLGDALRELNDSDAALLAFRAAVKIDPRLGVARSNLGQLLDDQGESDEALEHCLEAVKLEPALAASHNNLGNVYRSLERWSEAHAAYDAAQRLAPGLARIFCNRGLTLQLEGKANFSFRCFHRATELAPKDADMWRYLANAYVAEEDYAAALPCWEQIVALEPEHAQGYSELGVALQEEGRLAEADECYQRALELAPNFMDATLNQGGLHEELGEMTEAEAMYRRARSMYPWADAPLCRLATLLGGRLPDPDSDALKIRLGNMGPNAHGAVPCCFGMARVHDARDNFVDAAACLAEANVLQLKQNRKKAHNYDPVEHRNFVDRLIETFTPELFRRLAGAGDDGRTPIFVVGMPRSGTTLVEQVLSSHSRVHGAGELPLVRKVFDGIPAAAGQSHNNILDCLQHLEASGVAQLAHQFRESLQAILNESNKSARSQKAAFGADWPDRIVDKMPDNYHYLGLLALLFPRATLIHVKRDPRDVAVSCWMTNFRSIRWANDPEHLTDRIRQQHRIMAHWSDVLPVPVHEVEYERLVDDFEPEARRLLAACGLEWESACMEFHQTKRPVRTASIAQVRQPLYRKSVARWKHYETPLAELFALLPSGDAPAAELATETFAKTEIPIH